jgi:hypothetical protein
MPPQAQRVWQSPPVVRTFQPCRSGDGLLGAAYEVLLPIVRRALPPLAFAFSSRAGSRGAGGPSPCPLLEGKRA